MINTTLAHYKITAKLGQGGMGEVYRATDTKLGREVAIKVLPEAFASNKERLARFEREAKALAQLNHPNIASVHGFDQSEGQWFLAMELIEGEDLSKRIKRAPLLVEEALDVCKQIAEALEAAHEKGIIHRDLKPGNVKLTEDGQVKVLDFGLAKTAEANATSSSPADSMSPTIIADSTMPGTLLGTAAYMSPEQARGKPVDKRSDIWSFGCVLYECLTGKRTFQGEDTTQILARIIECEPDWQNLPASTPGNIRSLLRRCLTKDRSRRLRDIGDALLELEEAISTRSWTTSAIMAAPGPMYAGSKRTAVITWASLVALGAIIGWLGTSLVNKDVTPSITNNQERRVTRVSVTIPEFIESDSIQISPAGGLLAAIGYVDERGSMAKSTQVFTRMFGDNVFRPVSGTSGAIRFCFSPDGEWLAFTTRADRLEDGYELSKIAVDGSSPPLHLATVGLKWQEEEASYFLGLSWNRQNEVLMVDSFETAEAILHISAQTGDANILDLTEIDDTIAWLDAYSHIPDRNGTLYNVNKYTGG